MPDSSEATKMTVSSGLKCYESSEKRARLGCLAKMLLESSTWHSTRCVLTWKEKATPSSRLLFQLAPSTPRTGGTGFGSSLGTPTSRDWKDTGDMTNVPTNGLLGRQVAKAMLPTPQAMDSMAPKTAKAVMREFSETRKGRTNFANLKEVIPYGQELKPLTEQSGAATGARLRLQPAMTEWMMGYPKNWLSFPTEPVSPKQGGAKKLSKPTETASSPK